MAPFAELAVAIAADAKQYYDGLEETIGKTKSWAGNLGGIASAALGGAVVGAATAAVGGIAAISGAAFEVSKDTEIAAANMAASLDIPAERAQEFAEIARQVYGNNFAGDVVAAGEVVAEAYRRMGDVGEEQLQRVAEQAFAISDNFDAGPNEAISAAQTLMDQFGVDSDKAFDLIARGFQRGLNRSGDFLDTIEEYSIQFGEAGTSAEQFLGFLESGLQGGVLGTDKAADLFKEFFIRVQDGSDTTASALESIGISSEDLLGRLSDGTTTGAQAFDEVITKLYAIDDPLKLSQAGVALLGAQFEDIGQSLGSLDLIPDNFEEISGAADQLNAKYNNFGDLFAGIWRKAVVSVTPATDKLLELANDAMPLVNTAFEWLADKAPPAIDFVVDAVDTGVEFVKNLFEGPLGDGIDEGIGAFETAQDWIDTNMPLIQQTVETVLRAITTFWDQHGDRIMAIVDGFMSIVRTLFDTYLRNALDIVTAVMQLINGDVEGAGETLKGIVQRTMQAFFEIVGTYVEMIRNVFGDVDWGAVGRSIIDGIVAGLQGAGHLLLQAAQGAAQGALDGIKDLLGIRSPSAVMAEEVGLPMAQGVVQGFSANLPALENLSLDMSGMASALSGAASSSPAVINIYITSDDPRTSGDSVVQSLHAYGLAA